MRHRDTYRGARKRQARKMRIPWPNVPMCKVTVRLATEQDAGKRSRRQGTGKALLAKMVPTVMREKAEAATQRMPFVQRSESGEIAHAGA